MSDEEHGCTLESIYHHRAPHDLEHFHTIKPSVHHTVLYELPYQPNGDSPPTPYSLSAACEPFTNSVRLAPNVRCVMRNPDGMQTVENRWTIVCRSLAKPIANSRQLEAAIGKYNSDYRTRYQFTALHRLFEEQCDDAERAAFFGETLPRIIALALRLTELIRVPIPLLLQRQNRAVSMTQQQAACLLANAFLCTFPQPRAFLAKSYPSVNFAQLFAGTSQAVIEKLKCLCHYFRRVCTRMPTGVLTYLRRCVPKQDIPDWNTSPVCFTRHCIPMRVTVDGTIEDQGVGLLQMVFANRFIGGGVLGSGCVQEEIRFVINPELLVGRLLFESLRDNEAYLVLGAEQYCTYANYASSFTFHADHQDEMPRDASGRRRCYIVGIDALRVQPDVNQFSEEAMKRELAKAYVGFRHELIDCPAPGIATGNWGCGAFGGDTQLKALLQLMAACVAGRPLLYFTCNDGALHEQLVSMYKFLVTRRISVRSLFQVLMSYAENNLHGKADLYGYVYQHLWFSVVGGAPNFYQLSDVAK
ncbi:poly(ADP-ribose) glycohydrolase [Anopheles nili]|uniref:poly(ADP-ribose) glycohydrolase n=1 Tax=Anopheles nili TaxID=185578 RepID=UPI00237C1E1B|nr:poly(ADP-ribose) glycohydrolase [Anopheles nili]